MNELQVLVTEQINNKSKEALYIELLNRGFLVDDIAKAFDQAKFTQEEPKELHDSTLTRVTIAGAISIGIGIFSFIAANWQEYGSTLKVTLIVALMLAFYAGGILSLKRDWKKAGEALFLLGNITFGSGLFLVAQIYNVRINWPDGFIFWLLGTLPLAYVTRMKTLWVMGILLSIVAIIGYPTLWFDGLDVVQRYFFTPWVLSLVAAIITAATGIWFKRNLPEDIKTKF